MTNLSKEFAFLHSYFPNTKKIAEFFTKKVRFDEFTQQIALFLSFYENFAVFFDSD